MMVGDDVIVTEVAYGKVEFRSTGSGTQHVGRMSLDEFNEWFMPRPSAASIALAVSVCKKIMGDPDGFVDRLAIDVRVDLSDVEVAFLRSLGER